MTGGWRAADGTMSLLAFATMTCRTQTINVHVARDATDTYTTTGLVAHQDYACHACIICGEDDIAIRSGHAHVLGGDVMVVDWRFGNGHGISIGTYAIGGLTFCWSMVAHGTEPPLASESSSSADKPFEIYSADVAITDSTLAGIPTQGC